MNHYITMFPQISAHALIIALPQISVHPLDQKIRQVPLLNKCPPPLPTPLPRDFFECSGYEENLFLLPLYYFIICYASTLTVILVHHNDCVNFIMLLSWYTWLPKGGKYNKPLPPPPSIKCPPSNKHPP